MDCPGEVAIRGAWAVHLYEAPDDRAAVRLLENAIQGFNANDEDFRAKSLFAHYRLAILYAVLGKDAQSRQQIAWLIQNLGGSNNYFRSSLQTLLDNPRVDALRLCDAMYSATDADIPGEWKKFVNATAALNAYPYSPETYPPVICPLQQILTDKLEKVNWSVQPLLEKTLTEQEIPVHSMHTYPVPDQKVPASFMLVGDRTLYILAYVPAMSGWEWRLLDSFSSVNGFPTVFNQDITGDGYQELAYYQPRKDMWWCPENEQGYEIFLTTYSGFGLVSLSQSICLPKDQPFDINIQLADEDEDGVVDWVTDQIRESAGDSLLTAERMAPVTWFTPDEIYSMLPDENNSRDSEVDLVAELYTGEHPASTRQKLMAEMDSLSLADPFVDRRWQRLSYLIAVSYELEGQSDKAIETFKSILESNPQTLWGNLAELHLEIK